MQAVIEPESLDTTDNGPFIFTNRSRCRSRSARASAKMPTRCAVDDDAVAENPDHACDGTTRPEDPKRHLTVPPLGASPQLGPKSGGAGFHNSDEIGVLQSYMACGRA